MFELFIGAVLAVWVVLWQPSWADEGKPLTIYQVLVPFGGVLAGLVLLFLLFAVLAGASQRFTIAVTTVVNQTRVQANVLSVSLYTTPVVVHGNGMEPLQQLLHQGQRLQRYMTPTSHWGRERIDKESQEWLDDVAETVWQYLPDQAGFITSDTGLDWESEKLKYLGWSEAIAYRRIVVSHRLGILRNVCSQIPEFHMADSESPGV